ncbi:hypothetical protein HK405_013703 [Cladochytrium tenue]|nr:hypothetical protein HK405_013703 [Cladochytrium tenue]
MEECRNDPSTPAAASEYDGGGLRPIPTLSERRSSTIGVPGSAGGLPVPVRRAIRSSNFNGRPKSFAGVGDMGGGGGSGGGGGLHEFPNLATSRRGFGGQHLADILSVRNVAGDEDVPAEVRERGDSVVEASAAVPVAGAGVGAAGGFGKWTRTVSYAAPLDTRESRKVLVVQNSVDVLLLLENGDDGDNEWRAARSAGRGAAATTAPTSRLSGWFEHARISGSGSGSSGGGGLSMMNLDVPQLQAEERPRATTMGRNDRLPVKGSPALRESEPRLAAVADEGTVAAVAAATSGADNKEPPTELNTTMPRTSVVRVSLPKTSGSGTDSEPEPPAATAAEPAGRLFLLPRNIRVVGTDDGVSALAVAGGVSEGSERALVSSKDGSRPATLGKRGKLPPAGMVRNSSGPVTRTPTSRSAASGAESAGSNSSTGTQSAAVMAAASAATPVMAATIVAASSKDLEPDTYVVSTPGGTARRAATSTKLRLGRVFLARRAAEEKASEGGSGTQLPAASTMSVANASPLVKQSGSSTAVTSSLASTYRTVSSTVGPLAQLATRNVSATKPPQLFMAFSTAGRPGSIHNASLHQIGVRRSSESHSAASALGESVSELDIPALYGVIGVDTSVQPSLASRDTKRLMTAVLKSGRAILFNLTRRSTSFTQKNVNWGMAMVISFMVSSVIVGCLESYAMWSVWKFSVGNWGSRTGSSQFLIAWNMNWIHVVSLTCLNFACLAYSVIQISQINALASCSSMFTAALGGCPVNATDLSQQGTGILTNVLVYLRASASGLPMLALGMDQSVTFDLVGGCAWSLDPDIKLTLARNEGYLTKLKPILYAVCVITAMSVLFGTLVSNKVYKEYGWKLYHIQGASLERKWMLFRHQIFSLLIKLSIFVSMGIMCFMFSSYFFYQKEVKDLTSLLTQPWNLSSLTDPDTGAAYSSSAVLIDLFSSAALADQLQYREWTQILPFFVAVTVGGLVCHAAGWLAAQRASVPLMRVFLVMALAKSGVLLFALVLIVTRAEFLICRALLIGIS